MDFLPIFELAKKKKIDAAAEASTAQGRVSMETALQPFLMSRQIFEQVFRLRNRQIDGKL